MTNKRFEVTNKHNSCLTLVTFKSGYLILYKNFVAHEAPQTSDISEKTSRTMAGKPGKKFPKKNAC